LFGRIFYFDYKLLDGKQFLKIKSGHKKILDFEPDFSWVAMKEMKKTFLPSSIDSLWESPPNLLRSWK